MQLLHLLRWFVSFGIALSFINLCLDSLEGPTVRSMSNVRWKKGPINTRVVARSLLPSLGTGRRAGGMRASGETNQHEPR